MTEPGTVVLNGRARRENFPVAPRWIGAAHRDALRALYRFARRVDDLGDAPGGLDALDDIARAVRALPVTGPDTPRVVADLARWVASRGLPIEPLLALVQASRRDHLVCSYSRWADLTDYCLLSAVPVGTLVLHAFGAATPDRLAAAASVCTALQVLEHLQDVGEDHRRGRVYLPEEVLTRHQVAADELAADVARGRSGAGLRGVVAELAGRAAELLVPGRRLARSLPAGPRLAVAGFVAGGLAVTDALRAAGYDVLARPVRPSRARTLGHALGLLAGSPA